MRRYDKISIEPDRWERDEVVGLAFTKGQGSNVVRLTDADLDETARVIAEYRQPASPQPDERIERAYQQGGAAAAADAQACKAGQHGGLWHSREHAVPEDADARAAWMQGYGRVFAWWGGASSDEMRPDLRHIAQDSITGKL